MTLPLQLSVVMTLLLIATPAALAQAPYQGRWAEDLAWCRNTRASGTDEMPVTIWRRTIETFASACLVLSAVRTTNATWRLSAICRDEGQDESEPRTRVTFTLRVTGNRLALHDDTGVRHLLRCPH